MTSVKKLLKQARKIETSRDGILNNDHKEFQGEFNIGDIFEMPILQRLQVLTTLQNPMNRSLIPCCCFFLVGCLGLVEKCAV